MIKKRIVICGGHLSPALAVIEELIVRPDCELFYIGRINAFERDNSLSLEYKTIHDLNVPFYTLSTGRLQRTVSISMVLSLLKIPVGFIQSLIVLLKIRPDLVVSFGSYIALPVSLSALVVGIPVVTHEQTKVMGLTNRIISKFARFVCLSWPDTNNVPKGISVYTTGLPLRKSLFDSPNGTVYQFGDQNLPLIYITGGSSGSWSINHIVKDIISELLSDYRVIHQTGNTYQGKEYKYLTTFWENLVEQKKHNYKVVTHIPVSEMGALLRNTDLVVGRSGANTVAELEVFNIPSVLIPLPWSGQGEQQQNAQYLAKIGQAVVISQSSLTPTLLLKAIVSMLKKYPHRHMKKVVHAPKNTAASKFVKVLLGELTKE